MYVKSCVKHCLHSKQISFLFFWVKIMSILDLIKDKSEWLNFYNYKLDRGHLTKEEQEELEKFINEERYVRLASMIKNKDFNFTIPIKKIINKMGTNKKRIVYHYDDEENMILKFITYHLYKYDETMCDNCFSFRKNKGVKKAIDSIVSNSNINDMVCYKVDIKNYFNSINVDKLITILKRIIEDKELLEFMIKLLTLDKAIFQGEVIEEKRGAIAGVPFSPFLANVYLKELDQYFYDNKIVYARYSDDIIVFADNMEQLDEYKKHINEFILKMDLEVNKEKEYIFNKQESWNFLGIEYLNGKIDLSKNTIDKIKGKIKRKARAIYRWKVKKQVEDYKAMKVLTNCFNYKFFKIKDSHDLTWSRWFFPLINTDKGLKIVDEYLQQYLRYLSTGKHNKSNYRIRYKELKNCNYRSLVNEYYKFREQKHENLV